LAVIRVRAVAEEHENAAQTTRLEVDVAALAGMIEDGDVEVIDVRRDYEYEAGRLPGARHIELNELAANADSIPNDRPVVFYCRSGNRSGMAAEAFGQAGYDAHNLGGGIMAWVDLENPLEPEDGTVAGPRPV
jgi:rhodanese-related sulfurtransferase